MNQAVAGGGARRLHSRLLTVAEMQARDLMRRHVAMGLLLVLPLAFYGSLAGTRGRHAMGAGGVGMAFSIAGAAVFSLLASRRADPQLILAGYRPFELMLGRLLFLDAASAVIAGGFAWLMAVASGPPHPWAMALGTALTAVVAVPLGLTLGAVVPGELEGTLALIGIVGIQLSLPDNAAFGLSLIHI